MEKKENDNVIQEKRTAGMQTGFRRVRAGCFAVLLLFAVALNAWGQVYISPSGNDSNPGTIDLPYKTLAKGINSAGPDSVIYVRGGTYTSSSSITVGKNGSAGHYIKIWAYQGEVPVFDFSSMSSSSDGIKLSGTYIHLKGLSMTGAGHNGLNVSGHYNIIEKCLFYDNRNSGFQMGSSSSTANPGNNLILNCDSYRNFDGPIGGNADGYAVKWNIGTGNVFKGCRAWNNSDDGWDLWMAINTVIIDSCMAFRNGVDIWHTGSVDGNGSGFKLGGNNVAVPHTVRNCVSFDNDGNTGRGFDENNNLAGQTIYNCTAYRNKGNNFHFANSVVSGSHVIKNCISLTGNINITSGTRTNNSWQGFTVTTADFKSLDTNLAVLPRKADGTMQDSTFARLVATSSLINAGTNVGLPYYGSAPDLGAYEYFPPPIPQYTLTLQATNGTIAKNPSTAVYDSGSIVQLTALPSTGYHFTEWSGDETGSANPLSVTMNRNKSVTALFTANSYPLITYAEHGTITKAPNFSQYEYGTQVKLTALPDYGWKFQSWTGSLASIQNPDTVTIDTATAVTAVFVKDTIESYVRVRAGWNIISLPVTPVDGRKTALFPGAVSGAFYYANSYISKDTLVPATGYWLKMPAVDSIAVRGVERMADTIHVMPGWNLIGTVTREINPDDIIQEPAGIIQSEFYMYEGMYLQAETLVPGKGYWVNVHAEGELILSYTP